MPEIKSYAVELYGKCPIYIQHGERFDINGKVIIIDHDHSVTRMFSPDDIKSIKEGVFDGQ